MCQINYKIASYRFFDILLAEPVGSGIDPVCCHNPTVFFITRCLLGAGVAT